MAKTKHRGKGEGALFQRKDGTWVGRLELPPTPINPRPRKEVSSKDKQKVITKMREWKAELAEHGEISDGKIKLSVWMKTYLEDIAPNRSRPSTMKDKVSINKVWITPLLGRKRLDKLTAADVRRLHHTILNTPRDPELRKTDPDDLPPGTQMLSTSYASNAHNVLSAALRAAKREGNVRVNVCDLVDKPSVITRKDNSLTVEQLRGVLKRVDADKYRALWYTYLFTASRRGEVGGLEIERYDGRVLDLSWQLQGIHKGVKFSPDLEYRHIVGQRYLVRPKTAGSIRVTPVIEPLRVELDRHIGDRKTGFVFLNDDGEPFHPTTITKLWKSMMRELDLPHVTLHGTRHALIDLLTDMEVPERVIQDITGQSSRAVMQGYRTRANVDGALRALEGAWEHLGHTS